MLGLVSHIQGYSTKDGPGIRSTVFMMGCNHRCIWCSNPETIQSNIKILYHKRLCQKCGRCVKHAVNNSITLEQDGCIINRELCTNLHEMVDICPFNAYEKKGEWYTPIELATKLLKDKDYYDISGGGVTFSGGEATLQSAFVFEVAKILKQHQIHVAIDTAGLFDFDEIKPLLELVDLILYDIKTFDATLHKLLIKTDNKVIIDNLYKLSKLNKDIIIRLIIVPTLNDQEADFIKRLELIADLPNPVKQVDILPYHNLGVGKYEALGLDYSLKDLKEANTEMISKFYNLSVIMNLNTTIGG
ncbi:MAG: glycyl-radical enzyme activating protein [Erysipelotrichaceae bacterium]|nr:glycyl-radical enzyme activating protein [Erysipelotrichaceae bacterium]